MNIAIVGCGTMGKLYADHISKMENMNVTAVYHYRKEKALSFAERYKAMGFSDYQEMLEKASIDAVVIALPTYLHESFTIQAAKYGKHVLCEKPAALNAKEAESMFQACKENGVRLFIGHVLRFFPEYEKVASHVQKDELGIIQVVNAKRYSIHPPENSWFTSTAKSGGIAHDLMIHDIDFLIWLLGDVRSIYAKEKKQKGTHYVSATLEFHHKVIANIEAYWGYPGGFATQIEIAGTEGLVRNVFPRPVNELQTITLRAEDLEKNVGVEIPEEKDQVDPYIKQLEHFYSCVKNDEPFIVKEEEVLHSLRVVDCINRSLVTGQELRIGQPKD